MTRLIRGLIAVAGGVGAAAVLAGAATRLGGLVGGLLIGIGIYVAPEASDYLRRQREHAEADRERVERVSASAAVPVPLSGSGPAALLRPDRQVVGFIDRPELGRLREWCDDAEQPRVLVLTGAGDVGKTRRALQLASDREAVSSGPVLLVVGYQPWGSPRADQPWEGVAGSVI